MELGIPSTDAWLQIVLDGFDAFLLDHAACERKASGSALSLVAHYPDRPELVSEMIQLAREELDHFSQVYELIAARGLQLGPDRKDAYVRELRRLIRNGREHYFLDRLLVAGIAEARGCERFELIAGALTDVKLARFYSNLGQSEARHADLFVELANRYFDPEAVSARLDSLLIDEAKIVAALPLIAALH
jgi:tRNA-(ms[2]io[6]A)-hydroxylase